MSTMNRKFYILIIALLSIDSTLIFGNAAQFENAEPQAVNYFHDRDFLCKWVIAGPFPNEASEQPLPDGSYYTGYFTDYLVGLGEESKAILEPGQIITYEYRKQGKDSIRTKLIMEDLSKIINLEKIIGRFDNKTAYAFCYLNSDKDQTVQILLGSDDGVKVWINGDLVHQNNVYRGLKLGEDNFSAQLRKGLNPVLVKMGFHQALIPYLL